MQIPLQIIRQYFNFTCFFCSGNYPIRTMDHQEYLFYIYTVFFLVTALFSLLINAIFLKFSKTLGVRDHSQTVIRWSSTSKPAFGGISFFIHFLLSLATYGIFFSEAENIAFPDSASLGFLGATSLAFLMGLTDDAYNTRPLLKFTVQILCGVILIISGIHIEFFAYNWINYLLTIAWVAGIMNSFNMLDNMDGVSSSTAIGIICMALLYLILHQDPTNPDILICLGVLASLVGFLFFNWHPSKMFMGDAGSQFLGIFLAIIGIKYFWNATLLSQATIPARQIVIVLLAFALPIIDTSTVVINRISRKQSPFIGGKDHTTHHLSYLGLSDARVGFIFLLISIVNTALIYLAFQFSDWNHWHTLAGIAWFLALFGSLFYIASINKHKRK